MARRTTKRTYYVYVAERCRDKRRVIQFTECRKRVIECRQGKSLVTAFGGPWRIVYFESCASERDAELREAALKSLEIKPTRS